MLLRLAGERARFELGQSVSAAAPQRRKVSREGLLLIKSFEGFRPRAVHRRDGTLSIGYGHTKTARQDVEITEAEAELLLLHDLIPIVDYIHREIRRPLNQNQFDALVSFIFNIGLQRVQGTDVPNLIRKGQMASAAEALSVEPDRKPPPIDLPYRRRCAERALFETPAHARPDLGSILCAPVSRPGILTFPSMETPLGQTGVVRHEEPLVTPISTPKTRKEKCSTWRDFAWTLLLALLGLMVGIGTLLAFKHGLERPIAETYSLPIGAGLCLMGLALFGLAYWAYRSTRAAPKTV